MPLEIKNAEWIAVEQAGPVLEAIPTRIGGLYLIANQEQHLIASHGVERGLKHTLGGIARKRRSPGTGFLLIFFVPVRSLIAPVILMNTGVFLYALNTQARTGSELSQAVPSTNIRVADTAFKRLMNVNGTIHPQPLTLVRFSARPPAE